MAELTGGKDLANANQMVNSSGMARTTAAPNHAEPMSFRCRLLLYIVPVAILVRRSLSFGVRALISRQSACQKLAN